MTCTTTATDSRNRWRVRGRRWRRLLGEVADLVAEADTAAIVAKAGGRDRP